MNKAYTKKYSQRPESICLHRHLQTIANEIIVAFENNSISGNVFTKIWILFSKLFLVHIAYLYDTKYGTYCLEMWSYVLNAMNLTLDSY